jgi:hypothetical protein
MNVSESPNLIANSRIRPRLEKSSKAAKTAPRFVFAPASLIASLNSALGISNVVFIYKIVAEIKSKSRFLSALWLLISEFQSLRQSLRHQQSVIGRRPMLVIREANGAEFLKGHLQARL